MGYRQRIEPVKKSSAGSGSFFPQDRVNSIPEYLSEHAHDQFPKKLPE